MTDDQLVSAFESCVLPGDQFPHAAHVRVAWYYATRAPLLVAVARFRSALKRFAAAHGKPERYHETITIAYMMLVADRIDRTREESWEEFAARNDDLLRWNPSVLARFYSDDVLQSDAARQAFVLPHDAS
jgi:hypothetical protein